ncbi:hypothetical protein BHE74_00048647 [Ensete ventricosum]|nr:hypothetical protein BHE74_00048647 [Ensete ventricosum]
MQGGNGQRGKETGSGTLLVQVVAATAATTACIEGGNRGRHDWEGWGSSVGSDCSSNMAEEEGGDGNNQKGNDDNDRWPTGRGYAAVEQKRQRLRKATTGWQRKRTAAKDLR